MIKRILAAAMALLLAVLAGCADPAGSGDAPGTAAGETGRLRVVSTIFPPYDFVREIAGGNADLTLLLSPGTESHSYEPTPQDILTIQDCDLFIYVGGESDDWVSGVLDSMEDVPRAVVSLMDVVEPVTEELVAGMEEEHGHDHEEDHEHDEDHEDDAHKDGDEDHDHEEEPEYDEHVWTSPKNAMRIVEALRDSLCGLDEAGAADYRRNAEDYLTKLSGLDAAFKDAAASGVRKTLVFGDRFPFRYLTDEYGLTYYAAFPGCATETEASAATVTFLIDKVKEENIPVVFHIELSNEKMADTLCEATGAKKLLLHACHNVSKEDFENGATYLSLMTANVEALREALS